MDRVDFYIPRLGYYMLAEDFPLDLSTVRVYTDPASLAEQLETKFGIQRTGLHTILLPKYLVLTIRGIRVTHSSITIKMRPAVRYNKEFRLGFWQDSFANGMNGARMIKLSDLEVEELAKHKQRFIDSKGLR